MGSRKALTALKRLPQGFRPWGPGFRVSGGVEGLGLRVYALATRTQPDEVLGSRSDYTASFSESRV